MLKKLHMGRTLKLRHRSVACIPAAADVLQHPHVMKSQGRFDWGESVTVNKINDDNNHKPCPISVINVHCNKKKNCLIFAI